MPDFGGKLREARERRGIPLRAIAETTKISVSALEALERNDPSRLPGGIFARAIVRSYASQVGLDPGRTVRDFVAHFRLDSPPAAKVVPVPAAERPGRVSARAMLLVLASLAAALMLYFVLVHEADNPRTHPAGRTSSSAF